MMLEVLFARAAQRTAFLRMCLCGLAVGAALHISRGLHRRKRWLGWVWDVCCCAATAVAFGVVTLLSEGGVRAYGLLGLAVGAALYGAGIGPVLEAAGRFGRKRFAKKSEKQAGKSEGTENVK